MQGIEGQGSIQSTIPPAPAAVREGCVNLSNAQQVITQFGEKVSDSPSSLRHKTITTTPSKLDACDIFEKIRESICLISGKYKQGTGFLCNGLVISSFHVLEEEIRKQITFEKKTNLQMVMVSYYATTETIRVRSPGGNYPVLFSIPIEEDYESRGVGTAAINYLPNLTEVKEPLAEQRSPQQCIDNYFEKCRKLDIIALENRSIPAVDHPIEIIDNAFDLREGMKVYFGGFPLSQNSITFGRGIISSIKKDLETDIQYFTIDGTSVAGNSGSPVFIQDQGKIYLIGIVVSQIANWGTDLTSGFSLMRTFETLNRLQRGESLTLQKPHGQASDTTYLNELFFKSIVALKDNISTGIGKVIDIRCLAKLRNAEFSQANLRERSKEGEIPITRSQKPIVTIEIKNHDTLKTLGLTRLEATEIRISTDDRDVKICFKERGKTEENLRYRISPSPHCPETNQAYQNGEEDFYQAALDGWTKLFEATKPIPPSFTFKFHNHDFQTIRVTINGDLLTPEQSPLDLAVEEFDALELNPDTVENILGFLEEQLAAKGYYCSSDPSAEWEKWEKKGHAPITLSKFFSDKEDVSWILPEIYK